MYDHHLGFFREKIDLFKTISQPNFSCRSHIVILILCMHIAGSFLVNATAGVINTVRSTLFDCPTEHIQLGEPFSVSFKFNHTLKHTHSSFMYSMTVLVNLMFCQRCESPSGQSTSSLYISSRESSRHNSRPSSQMSDYYLGTPRLFKMVLLAIFHSSGGTFAALSYISGHVRRREDTLGRAGHLRRSRPPQGGAGHLRKRRSPQKEKGHLRRSRTPYEYSRTTHKKRGHLRKTGHLSKREDTIGGAGHLRRRWARSRRRKDTLGGEEHLGRSISLGDARKQD